MDLQIKTHKDCMKKKTVELGQGNSFNDKAQAVGTAFDLWHYIALEQHKM